MKKQILIIGATILTGLTQAQDIDVNNVPSVILNEFNSKFPKASDVEWEIQGTQYNVEFEMSFHTDYEAWFDSKGNLLVYNEEISYIDLPESVKRTLNNQFYDYKIDDIKKIIENNKTTYSVELEKGKLDKNLLFSEDGKLI